jgi:hypothetical protein
MPQRSHSARTVIATTSCAGKITTGDGVGGGVVCGVMGHG